MLTAAVLPSLVIYSCALAAAFWTFIEQFWHEDDNDSNKNRPFLSSLQLLGPIGPHKLFFGLLTLLYCGRFFEFFYSYVFRNDADNSTSNVLVFVHILSSCFYMGSVFIVSVNTFCKLHRVSQRTKAVLVCIAAGLLCVMIIATIMTHFLKLSTVITTDLIETFIVLCVFLDMCLLLTSTMRLKNWAKRLKASFAGKSGRGRYYVVIFQVTISAFLVILGLQTVFSFLYLTLPKYRRNTWFAFLYMVFMLWLPEVFPGGIILALIMRGRDLNRSKKSNGNDPRSDFTRSTHRSLLLDESNGRSRNGISSQDDSESKYEPIKLGKITFKNSYEAGSSTLNIFKYSVYDDSETTCCNTDENNTSSVDGGITGDVQPEKNTKRSADRPPVPSQTIDNPAAVLDFDDIEVDIKKKDAKPQKQDIPTEYTEFAMHVIYRNSLIDTIVIVHTGEGAEESKYRDLLGSALKEGALIDGEIDRIDLSLHDKVESLPVIPKTLLIPNTDIDGCDEKSKKAPSLLLLALGHDPKSDAGSMVLGLANIRARSIYSEEPIGLLYKDTVLEAITQPATQQQQQKPLSSSSSQSSKPDKGASTSNAPAKYPPLHCVGSFVLHKNMVHTLCSRSLAQGSCVRTFVCNGNITEFDGLYSKDVTLNVREELWESTFAFGIPRDIIAATVARRERQLDELTEAYVVDTGRSPSEFTLASFGDASVQQTLTERMAAIIQGLSDHIKAMKEYCHFCSSGRLASSFKASVQKKSGALRFNPTNLHVQFMTVFPREIGTDAISLESSTEDRKSYAFVTLGATVAYGYNSGCEDGAYQLAKRIDKFRAAESSTQNSSIEEKLTAIVLDMVRDVVVCQIACALADAFAAEVERRARFGCDKELKDFFAQVENIGFLVCFESLLSTFGQERQMLGDFEYAVCCLDKFKLKLMKTFTDTASSTCIIIFIFLLLCFIFILFHIH